MPKNIGAVEHRKAPSFYFSYEALLFSSVLFLDIKKVVASDHYVYLLSATRCREMISVWLTFPSQKKTDLQTFAVKRDKLINTKITPSFQGAGDVPFPSEKQRSSANHWFYSSL